MSRTPGSMPQRIKIVEIGDAREHGHGDRDGAVRPRAPIPKAERVFRRQARGFGKERQRGRSARQPVRSAIVAMPSVEQGCVAAELVDDEADDRRGVLGRERRLRSENLREYAAAIDVADERDRALGGAREAHVGDVALAQVDLRRAARAFDQHEIGARP